MKKSLSVILSTTMALSAFSSVALAASSADFSDLKDLSAADKVIFDQLIKDGIFLGVGDGKFGIDQTMKRSQFAVAISKALKYTADATVSSFPDVAADAPELPYIEAAYKNGVANGNTDGTFAPAKEVSREELAIFLVGAMGPQYKAEAEAATGNDATVTSWAQGYVATALKYKLMETTDAGFNGKTPATRYMLAKGVDATLKAIAEANKPATATKVESVSASNLKEVVVTFDGPVDKDTAGDKANYSLKSGKQIDDASVSEDGTSVTLTVVNTLSNNKVDAVSVSNVKAGDITLNVINVEFTTIDNAIPEVAEVKSLGTKSVKVVFNEPVTGVKQSNFTLDGKAFYGKVTQLTTREYVLTPSSSSALAVGDHTIVVSGVKDFANFVSLNSTHEFTVVEDTEAPTVIEATATLEKVVLTFSEDVDADTVKKEGVYWKSGSTKKTATGFKRLAGNKYEFYFEGKELPTGAVTIYVEGVKDYSGNTIAKDTTVVVTPEIDQTRPEVKKVESVNSKQIKVTFSKNLTNDEDLRNQKNYTVTNKDDKVLAVKAAKPGSEKNEVIIDLYEALSTGTNKITIKNLKDATKLKNTMLDFSGEIKVGDTTAPKLESPFVNTAERQVIVQFNKKMDAATLQDYSNYLVVLNGTTVPLTPEMAEINVLQNDNAVSITFVDYYKDKKVHLKKGTPDSKNSFITQLHVLGVKDAASNLLENFTKQEDYKLDISKDQTVALADYDSDYKGKGFAALVDTKTVKVKFNGGVTDYRAGAFEVLNAKGQSILKDVDVDGTSTVTLTLSEEVGTDLSNLDVRVNLTDLTTLAGSVTSSGKPETVKVLDLVKPVIKDKELFVTAGDVIEINFSEALAVQTVDPDLIARDFKIKRYYDGKELKAGQDYKLVVPTAADLDKGLIKIQLLDQSSRKESTIYIVEVLKTDLITDRSPAKNGIDALDPIETKSVNEGATGAALDAAKKAVADAKAEVAKAEAADTAAKGEVTKAEAADTAAKGEVSIAQDADIVAKAEVLKAEKALNENTDETKEAELKQAVEDAKAEATKAADALEVANAEAKTAADALKAANAEATKAADALKAAKDKLEAAEKVLADLEKA